MTRPVPPAGTKRRCISCGAKFYDLDRRPIACPKCNAEVPDNAPIVS